MIFNTHFNKYKKIPAISILLSFFLANIVYAQGYVPLESLPGVSKTGTNLTEYLTAIFNIGIGLAGVFAVLMIVVGGIQYIAGAASPSARSEAKKRITNAIFGLILASASWLILYTINPNLVKSALNISTASVDLNNNVVSDVNIVPNTKTPIPTPATNSYPISQPLYAPTSNTSQPTVDSQSIDNSNSYPNTISSNSPAQSNYNESILKSKPKPLPPPDTTNDFNFVKDCLSRKVSGVCAPADINKDGVIDYSDLYLLSSAFKYDVNGDGVVAYKKDKPISSCFLKESSGPIPTPDAICDTDYGTVSCPAPVPEVQTFPVQCATKNYTDKVINRTNFNKMREVIIQSSSLGKVNLRSLYSNLFELDCGEFEASTCNLFKNSDLPIGDMIYSTMVQYDTNKDGIADFTGKTDPLIDFNGDGVINSKDSAYIKFINESVFKNKGFTPINFTFGGIEAIMFDGSGFTDRQIVQYCIGKPAIMSCAMTDIDGSCSKTRYPNKCDINKADLSDFDKNASLFDINKDGVVDFAPPQAK